MTTTDVSQNADDLTHDGAEDDPDAPEFPRAFGQYVLLHRLARGGMGNVFLAKTGGSMGIEKHCVVKTLRSRYTGDSEYVGRFMEEARVVVQLTHRNICPVFDVGRVGRTYYLAMELVVGRDIRSVQVALQDHGKDVPLDCAIHIVSEMLDALDYAHRHADPVSGVPLNLVHRDVSPQNVMINTEGEVKLIDFGLAESHTSVNEDEPVNTGTTTVMGKIAYMAPEHARGDPVDARADQFSAAVVAYELFVGDRYYAGLSTHQVWQRAGTGAYQPEGLSALDPGLRAVLARALSPNREDRYASCADFREDLLAYARTRNLHAGARDLRSLMQQTFADDVREMRELLQRFAHVSRSRLPGFVAAEDEGRDYFSIASSGHVAHMPEPTEMLTKSAALYEPPSRSWPVVVSVAGVAVVAIVAIVIVVLALQPSTPPTVTIESAPPPPIAPLVAQPAAEPPATPPSGTPVVAAGPQATESTDPKPAPPRKRSAKPQPPKKPQFKSLTITKKIELLGTCEPCGPPLARAGSNVGRMDSAEITAWMSKAEACLVKCGAVVP